MLFLVLIKKEVENEDLEFLFKVFLSTRMDEVIGWGWDNEQIFSFLQMQFHAQQCSYALQYPNMESRIVVFNNEKAGRILISEFEERLVVVDITLLPEFQNNGIGTKILSDLLSDAKKKNKYVQLSVLQNNVQAKKLYKRLGFKPVSENEMYVRMEWS